jgi:hypothetical protein
MRAAVPKITDIQIHAMEFRFMLSNLTRLSETIRSVALVPTLARPRSSQR